MAPTVAVGITQRIVGRRIAIVRILDFLIVDKLLNLDIRFGFGWMNLYTLSFVDLYVN